MYLLKLYNFIYEIFNGYASHFVPSDVDLDLEPVSTMIDVYMNQTDSVLHISEVGSAIFDMFAMTGPVLNSLVGVAFSVLISGVIVSIVMRIL